MKRVYIVFVVLALFMTTGFVAAARVAVPSQGYKEVDLVSDGAVAARFTDPNLVNPWGLSVLPSGRIWVSDNGAGTSTVYHPDGRPFSLVVSIPGAGGVGKGAPTGLVFNDTMSFDVTANGVSAASRFIFATEDGTILGWNPTVDPTDAVIAVDNSASGAVYKGIALGKSEGENFVYVANFRDGIVEMYDENFTFVKSFTDDTIPAGFAPFGIRNIGGSLYVTYAMQDAAKHDDVAGAGNGYIDVFDTNGTFVKRFASQGTLNSPWGLASSPDRFGTFSKAILVGNFGDGHINAYDADGNFLGQLTDMNGMEIVIDGLWGLDFGSLAAEANRAGVFPRPVLYFTAGINHEADGLFGFLRPFSPFRGRGEGK